MEFLLGLFIGGLVGVFIMNVCLDMPESGKAFESLPKLPGWDPKPMAPDHRST